MSKNSRYIPLLLLVALVVAGACSTKKNTAGSRFWQAFNTRYNVYYHGKTNYDEQIKKLEDEYQDDYSQHVFVHPAEAYSNPKSPQPSGSFDRTIEKMQKAIALHSIKKKPKKKSGKGSDPKYQEWMKREEYNPFLHNAWYLLAKSQYMKGDFLSSSATFRYITRHFSWKKELVVECQVWEALSYCAMGWTTEADNVLAHIHLDQIEDGRVLGLANLAFADYYIKDKQYAEAIPYLAEATRHAGGSQKVRLNFLLGQLYEENEQYDLAYEAFKRAGSSSQSSYRTKFNARIKQSAVFHGDNIEGEVRGLRHMTRYDRNKEYLDQIYYAIGNLYLSKQDTVHAIENYVLAAKKSTRNGIDKAISQLKLGGIYFDQHKYDLAQPCYSEAVPQLGEDYPNYKMLKQRSDVLDELAVYAQNVTLQDSLLRLSKMTPDEQRAVIKKIIEELKKKEKEEKENAEREEYLAQQQAKGTGLKTTDKNAPQNFELNTDKSWYFYNTAAKNAGKTQFQQRWGNRKLEDNWRRRNKNTFSLDEDNSDNAGQMTDSLAAAGDSTANQQLTKEQQEALKRSEDPHYEEYYLKQIPKTDEEIQTSNDVIQEGLYNMGLILKDKMEDLPAAAAEFETLLERYPDNTYRLDTYYNLYLLHKRAHNELEAEKYRRLIITEFAESDYGVAMKDPNYLERLKLMEVEQEKLYDKAYNAYLNNDNVTVHSTYAYVNETFPLSKIMPKFMFIDALSYVTEHNGDKFKERLKEMLERFPDTDITPMASAMVKGLNQGRKINGSGGNLRGMFWSTRLSNDTTAADIEKQFTPFSEGKNKPQYFVLVYSTDSVSSNQLLYEVARHNFNAFVVKDFDLEQMNFGNLGLLIVKGFANHREVSHYRTLFEEDAELTLPRSVLPVIISKDNFELLLNEGRSFEDYFRYLDEQNNKDVESLVPQLQQLEQQAEKQALEELEEEEEEEEVDETKPENEVKPEAETKPATETKPESATKPETETTPAPEVKTETTTPATTTSTPVETQEKTQPSQSSQPSTNDDKKDDKKDKDNIKRLKKQKDEETKRLEREEKQRRDSIKRLEKEQEKLRKAKEKAERDSIKAAEKAEREAARQAEREKEEAAKAAEREKENAKKAAEQERKDKAKAKEEARKQREKERKERAKQREQERKEQAKRKKEEAKARKEAAKQRRKEREEAAKERRRQREEERRNRK